MPLTDYHAQYFAHELTKRCSSDKLEKLASTFAGARVDLNPHQVEAALFAFRSPLSKGALLADEVGLGKTIEAGLVIAQKWAERKRRILVVTPASLRKQWLLELKDKFFLPGKILETKSYNKAKKDGSYNPFDDTEHIIFCSYQFARNKAGEVESTQWDLVVIDEAHRLRNVYKSSNKIAKKLREILQKRNKLLLTATPLQNSLLELYGLVSFIDELTFGDVKSFKEQFTGRQGSSDVFETLKRRLKPICHRTLRRQVDAYVSFTARLPLLEKFDPDDSKEVLYELVSDYLQRDNIKDFDRQIREAKRAATGALDLQAKLVGQKRVRELERSRTQRRRSLFEAQDDVDARRDNIIDDMEKQLEQKSELERLFTIRWSLV
ncbi:DEAD/DEAH box helicase [Leptolyngbya sp. BC1307]|uniref:DEAD/DEAH box helicase n=1 Tax=Leptolyngbya sp. BC1307 TaxID=2029589 RepID=UPI000EFAFCD1|nr:DEAD/DEAH box helicase [Leptolyngbya sp. BC1307]